MSTKLRCCPQAGDRSPTVFTTACSFLASKVLCSIKSRPALLHQNSIGMKMTETAIHASYLCNAPPTRLTFALASRMELLMHDS